MEIIIDDELQKWLKEKGNHITIKKLIVNGCCAPGVQESIAVPGKPKNLNKFKQYKVEDIGVYIENSVSLNSEISLKLSGFGFFKSISIT